MNVAEYVSQNPSHNFSSYMSTIAGTMNLDLQRLDMEDFTSCIESPDPSIVNPILFKKLNEAAVTVAMETEPSNFLSEFTFPVLKLNLGNEISRLTREAQSSSRDAQNRYDQFNTAMELTTKTRMRLALYEKMELEGKNIDSIETQITKIESDGWWRFVSYTNGDLYFQTGPILMREYNPAAGIDLSVDFGQFLIRFPIDGSYSNMKAYPLFMNPIKYGKDAMHPHVSITGTFCWGDAAEIVAQAMSQQDLVTAADMLRALLITYEPSNPYTALSTFARNKERIPFQRIAHLGHRDARRRAVPNPRYGEIDLTNPEDRYKDLTILKSLESNGKTYYYVILGQGKTGFTYYSIGYVNPIRGCCAYGFTHSRSTIDYTHEVLGTADGFQIVEKHEIPNGLWEAHLQKCNEGRPSFNEEFYLKPNMIVYGLTGPDIVFNGEKVIYLTNDTFMYKGALIESNSSPKWIDLALEEPLRDTCFWVDGGDNPTEFSDIQSLIFEDIEIGWEYVCNECGESNSIEEPDEVLIQRERRTEFIHECHNCGHMTEGEDL